MSEQSATLASAARTLIKALGSATSSNDFCKLVVHSVLNEQQANSCFIAILGNDSNIKAVGTYGYEYGVFEKAALSVWDPSGISTAIRTGEVQKYDSEQEYKAAYDHNRFAALPGNGYLAIPFIASGQAVGGIGISFQLKLSEINLSDELIDLLQLAAQFFTHPNKANGSVPVSKSMSFEMLSSEESVNLTEREELILSLMAAGKTNQEIGVEMHLSASTIRSASVSLFRTLSVHSRKDAVAAAKHLGLLDAIATKLAPPPAS
jgi:DNA-binding CsgD family transcriptional regulator